MHYFCGTCVKMESKSNIAYSNCGNCRNNNLLNIFIFYRLKNEKIEKYNFTTNKKSMKMFYNYEGII
ncbi:hypothetical protein [Leptotrichia sp. oral taxon 225]|uniref:hypothetical protein n=1 Tax=unclassified Leptotrichia TaxID=2633022 RepID=UPI0035107683